MTEILGFSKATFDFLRGLTENNEKSWFDAHRDDYERYVREPFVATLEAAAEATVGGPLELHGGRQTMFRINRDVRFSKDKSPYKTAVGGLLTPTGDKREHNGVAYLHLAVGGGFLACGFHQLSPAQLTPIRDQIIERAEEFTAVLSRLADRGRALSDDDSLRAMPRGYADYADHQHAQYLRCKSFMLMQNLSQKDWLTGAVVDQTAALVADGAELIAFVAHV
ncbi:MAG: DUF2461 domain-containing protein [Mycolicibacterium sp.]|uniref:DUF2461 domain-containing protein n=1 Tax=Mycolicibacterium sp. TaxID=2320850 RepID=UPI003D139813